MRLGHSDLQMSQFTAQVGLDDLQESLPPRFNHLPVLTLFPTCIPPASSHIPGRTPGSLHATPALSPSSGSSAVRHSGEAPGCGDTSEDRQSRKQNVKYFFFLYTEYRKVSVKSKTLQLLCTVELAVLLRGGGRETKETDRLRQTICYNRQFEERHTTCSTVHSFKTLKNAITDVFTQNPTLFLI